jgi:protease PrsW
MAGTIRFRDLRPLVLEREGAPLPVGGARLVAALGLLLVHAGRPVSVGTIVAATLEFDVLRDLGGLPMFGVGLIEETSKLLVPLALLLVLRTHRTRADGLLIGVACGAGFAALETMGYRSPR